MSAILVPYLDDFRQSAFLLDAAAKATVLLVAATLATALLRRSSAAVRHRIWCLTFAALILLPGLSAALPEWRLAVLPQRSSAAPRQESSPLAPQAEGALTTQAIPPFESDFARHPAPLAEQAGYGVAEQAAYRAPLRREIQSPPIRPPSLAAAWLVGAIVALAPLIIGLARTLLLRRQSLPINDTNWHALLGDLRQRLALARRVGLYENASALMPMTWGVLRPVVMLPRQAREWTDRLRRIVLLHELAHIKRCDVGFQFLGRVACAVYWFHPLAWYALRRLRIERELACDDCVVLAGERATDYAADLVEIARSYRAIPFAAAVAMAQRSNLEHRLRAMFDGACSHLPVSARAARALLTAVLLLVTIVAAVRLAPRVNAGDDKPGNALNQHRPIPEDDLITVSGQVVDPDGSPFSGARVSAVRWYWDPHIPHPPLAETRGDAEGRFTIGFRKSQFNVDLGQVDQWKNTAIVATA
ncbi:MAG TPA: M56 family metallopeptidase, partial [Pirellulales bacterium]|nr:M56 family metallopeptidase [Pirellulales bacterium]